MVLGIQILGIVFGIFLIYFTFLNYKRKEFSKAELVIWAIVWVMFIYLTLLPNSLDFVAEKLNLVRTMDFLTILGFMFLISFTFYNYQLNIHNRRKLERVVRAVALKNKKK